MSNKTNSATMNKVEVTLTGSHTHKGKQCVAGNKIDVTPEQKQWLIEQGKVAQDK